ncbi:CoA transferase [Microbacteriaceae bacterium VKM Ac-2855]|nr:CoA transferase [Microbacteriaceae bacterium VKM Ac-2855]
MTVLESAWAALGEDPRVLDRVHPGGYPDLPARLPVAELVRDSVATASLAAALLSDAEAVELDADRVRTAVTSERHTTIDGRRPDVWAELSGFWPTAEGWLRSHANYPHHRSRLLAVVGLPEEATKEQFAARALERSAREIEESAARAGAIAVAVRGEDEWAEHPQARAVREQPLITVRSGVDAGPVHAQPGTDPRAPLAGIRVLDLTRVISGPVATRTLAWLGADVLRVDDPTLPELPWQHLDTGAGKRSTLLDLDDARDRARFDELLDTADVLVTGYRPGGLSRFGLNADELQQRRPDLVLGSVSAWGSSGPWSQRRGFDSIVQAVSGIAVIQGDERPGALPAQALDHSGGYLLAAGVASALRRRRGTDAGATIEVALARLAQELLDRARPGRAGIDSGAATLVSQPTSVGALSIPLPALSYSGGATDWPAPARPWGADAAQWRSQRAAAPTSSA